MVEVAETSENAAHAPVTGPMHLLVHLQQPLQIAKGLTPPLRYPATGIHKNLQTSNKRNRTEGMLA
jgi:hypothetical protein